MVTLKMVAKACGVSVATVSKALNGAPDISVETAAKIRKAAEELGYIPCAAAQYLKTSRSHNIGVILDDGTHSGLTHEHFAYILDAFKRRAEALGYDITLISDAAGPWGTDYVTHIRFRNCDGVAVLVAENAGSTAAELVRIGIPVISVDYHFENCSCVESDNYNGIADLVRYIHSCGHRKIAAIFGDDNPVTRLRKTAFYDTCAALGLEIPEDYVISGLYHENASSAEATKKLMSLPEPPTCIMYPDDFSFMGGKRELDKLGLVIPAQISVTGFDGLSVAKILRPRLTTVQQDTETIGKTAAEEMVKAIEAGSSYVPTVTKVSCCLIEGGTVAKL